MKKRIIIVTIVFIVLVICSGLFYAFYLKNRIMIDNLVKLNEEKFDLMKDFELTIEVHDEESEDLQNYKEKIIKEGNVYTYILSLENKESGELDVLKISEEINLDDNIGRRTLYNDDKTKSERSLDVTIVEDYKERVKKNIVPLLQLKDEEKLDEVKELYKITSLDKGYVLNDGVFEYKIDKETGFTYEKENENKSRIEKYEFKYL